MAFGVFQQHVLRLRRRLGVKPAFFQRMGVGLWCAGFKGLNVPIVGTDVFLPTWFRGVAAQWRYCQVSPLCCQHFGHICER